MKNQNMIIGCIVSAAIAGGVGFWGGTTYQKNQVPAMGNLMGGRGANTAQFGQNGRNSNIKNSGNNVPAMNIRGNGAITGEVIAKDDKSITIKMTDGSSKIVIISDSTTYRLSEESSLDKVSVGTKVATFGTTNSDGSTTATNIEINPIMMGQELRK